MIHQKSIIKHIKSFLHGNDDDKEEVKCFWCEFTPKTFETCMICNDDFWSSQFEYPNTEKTITIPDIETSYAVDVLEKKIRVSEKKIGQMNYFDTNHNDIYGLTNLRYELELYKN